MPIHRKAQDLVGSSEAARILSVHPATVTRMVGSDQLTPVGRLDGGSGAFVFNRSDVVSLAEKRKAEAEAER
jgi:hypothetical protein